ncbi:unnamed protein product [Ambrosiozyma monospora]|uniref:Unnamed protein product n=1 Tax=Ambrosiozyma monospora TaxID=43982 RepID=A0A9W7DJ72_AMBMO|nr:unnamed protein product [Ambrosiozyma monospora]
MSMPNTSPAATKSKTTKTKPANKNDNDNDNENEKNNDNIATLKQLKKEQLAERKTQAKLYLYKKLISNICDLPVEEIDQELLNGIESRLMESAGGAAGSGDGAGAGDADNFDADVDVEAKGQSSAGVGTVTPVA